MDQELLDLLARLNDADNPLTDDELATLLTGLRTRAEELAGETRTPEVVAELQQIATHVGEVRTEQTTRTEAQEQRDADAQAALDAIAEGDDDQDGEGDDAGDGSDADAGPDAGDDEGGSDADAGDGDEGGTVTDLPTATGDAPAAGDQAPAAVAASASPRTAARAPHDPRRGRNGAPRPSAPRAVATLTAAGDVPGLYGGQEITDWDGQVGEGLFRKMRSLARGGSAMIASLRTQYPEERMLRRGDAAGNDRKIRAVTSDQALTASGGICGPVNVDYAVPVFASTERPVRDALARFGADRGGITFTPAPTITSVASATGIWTEAIDAGSPGNSQTKARLAIACESPTTVEVDAITTQLEFGEMQGRFYPEYVAAVAENAIAAAARVADTNLLNKIHALSTEVTLAPSVGAARGALEVLGQAIAGIKYRLRLSDSARFRIIPPMWLLDMIMVDFAKELPSGTDRLSVGRQMVEQYLAARNTTASWALDGVAAQGSGNTYPLQGFASQSSGALAAWPTKVTFPIFVEGTFQFLDGGELNLGVLRDSTLAETNDYVTVTETFENVAFRGIESLWAIATLVPTGGSSGTVTPANP